jgi:hypothetical protein
MHENAMPTKRSTAHAARSFGLWLMLSASITKRIAVAVNNALKPAHSISASRMLSRFTGAFMMPSHVFCTCMRENAE